MPGGRPGAHKGIRPSDTTTECRDDRLRRRPTDTTTVAVSVQDPSLPSHPSQLGHPREDGRRRRSSATAGTMGSRASGAAHTRRPSAKPGKEFEKKWLPQHGDSGKVGQQVEFHRHNLGTKPYRCFWAPARNGGRLGARPHARRNSLGMSWDSPWAVSFCGGCKL